MAWNCSRAGEEPQVLQGQARAGAGLHLGHNQHFRLLELRQVWVLDGVVVEVNSRHWINSEIIVTVLILSCIERTLSLKGGRKPLPSLVFVEHLTELHPYPGRSKHQRLKIFSNCLYIGFKNFL